MQRTVALDRHLDSFLVLVLVLVIDGPTLEWIALRST
jgi:hypothetical protein